MPHKLKYTNDDLIRWARDYLNKYGRVPKVKDARGGFARTVIKRFGSWNIYIRTALDKPANHHEWTREELITLLRDFWKKNNRFPIKDEIVEDGRDIYGIIVKYFGSVNSYFEEAIGTSPRVEILRALKQLTPPGCDAASPSEIIAQIRKIIPMPQNLYAFNMRSLAEEGYAVGGKYDRTRWWKLTTKGLEFLKRYEASNVR